MKPTSFITLILVFLICPGINSQSTLTNLSELTSFMKSDYSYIKEQRERNSQIEGTPYLDEGFTEGKLVYQDKLYKGLQLRYNIYEGHFEFKSEGEILYFDPRYTEVDTVWIGQEKYIYAPYADNSREKRSYMHLLYDGNTQVLSLRETLLLQPEKAQGYADAKPARFRELPPRMFVSKDGKPAVEFSNRRSIEEVFPDHADKLETYAKKQRLRFRSPDELVELVEYYEDIR